MVSIFRYGQENYDQHFPFVAVSKQMGRELSFRPVVTDMGFCLAANAEPMGQILSKKTTFRSVFEKAFSEEKVPEVKVMNNIGRGKHYALTFITDTHMPQERILQNPRAKAKGHFISLKWKHDLFGVRQETERLRHGYTTVIRVTTVASNVTEDVRNMETKARGCRMTHENENMEVFEHYTQKGCQFECHLKKAAEICRCIPWNYPNPVGNESRICDTYGAMCFEEVMGKHVQDRAKCDCPQNCEEIRFTYSLKG